MRASFIDPMLLLRTEALPAGENWLYELKFDGYRAIGFKARGHAHLRSRSDNDLAQRFPGIATALDALPDETVIDGEVVALDEAGRPSFHLLQNYGSAKAPLVYYVFDAMVLEGHDVRSHCAVATPDHVDIWHLYKRTRRRIRRGRHRSQVLVDRRRKTRLLVQKILRIENRIRHPPGGSPLHCQ